MEMMDPFLMIICVTMSVSQQIILEMFKMLEVANLPALIPQINTMLIRQL